VGLVPQGRRVFKDLSVEDNLRIAARKGVHGNWSPERVYDLLPRLSERRAQLAGLLSGGEQQMLAIGRALVGNPRLLLLDEPSDGLAPAILLMLSEVMRRLRDEGLTVLVVEQDISLALTMADTVSVLEKGVVKHTSSVNEFRNNPALARELLGVG
jgi:branched-chain amino acid transport system ATP-binding protein